MLFSTSLLSFLCHCECLTPIMRVMLRRLFQITIMLLLIDLMLMIGIYGWHYTWHTYSSIFLFETEEGWEGCMLISYRILGVSNRAVWFQTTTAKMTLVVWFQDRTEPDLHPKMNQNWPKNFGWARFGLKNTEMKKRVGLGSRQRLWQRWRRRRWEGLEMIGCGEKRSAIGVGVCRRGE